MWARFLYDQHELWEAVMRRLRDFVTVFSCRYSSPMSACAAISGTIHGGLMWALCGLVVLVAIAGKIGGCTSAALLNGLPWKEAWSVVVMNTRGLIAVRLGHDLGSFLASVFFMLVLMAVVTTYMTSRLIRKLIGKAKLERIFEVSSL